MIMDYETQLLIMALFYRVIMECLYKVSYLYNYNHCCGYSGSSSGGIYSINGQISYHILKTPLEPN